LIGRQAGNLEGYSYSAAMKASGIAWSDESLSDYFKDPKAKVPGTKMIYPGLKDAAKVADLLAYLKQFDATGKKAP
jgi:cytochrome c